MMDITWFLCVFFVLCGTYFSYKKSERVFFRTNVYGEERYKSLLDKIKSRFIDDLNGWLSIFCFLAAFVTLIIIDEQFLYALLVYLIMLDLIKLLVDKN